MLHYLLNWIEDNFAIPGFGVFDFISARSGFAAVTSLLISMWIGKKMIHWLRKINVMDKVRSEFIDTERVKKENTPTMGGIILVIVMIFTGLLWMDISIIFTWLLLFTVLVLGIVGFIDDYIKTAKKNKKGLSPIYKLIGQIFVALVVGTVLYYHPVFESFHAYSNIPFFKNYQLDYAYWGQTIGFVLYVSMLIFAIAGTSNGANLTDGMDGLTIGITVISTIVLAIFCYVAGRMDYANFLDIQYIPYAGELTIFCASMIGACLGFLWYNAHPAAVFMGDTGSLTLGGALAVIAVMIRKELFLPIICAMFMLEICSVILQVWYFKYTRYKYGEGKRLFLMAPIHHHFEKKGWQESKIVVRFWIIAFLFSIVGLLTLKVR